MPVTKHGWGNPIWYSLLLRMMRAEENSIHSRVDTHLEAGGRFT
jgi:hypothetical protein